MIPGKRWLWLMAPLLAGLGLLGLLQNLTTLAQPVGEKTVLYDGSLGTLPAAQGYFQYLTNPFFGVGATQQAENGATTLTTTADISEQAGYFGQNLPTLDRQTGYEVVFRARVADEIHNSDNRAGFSVIALSDDLLGIELGFWEDAVWAQEGGTTDLFTRAETGAFMTTAWTTYTVRVLADSYRLSVGETAVVSGTLRDYTAFDGTPDVYETPNFLFFGDNTSSAAVVVQLAYIAVVEGPFLDEIVYLPLVVD